MVDEFSAQVAAAQAAAAAVRDELAAAHAAASEWRGRAERLERDTASLQVGSWEGWGCAYNAWKPRGDGWVGLGRAKVCRAKR